MTTMLLVIGVAALLLIIGVVGSPWPAQVVPDPRPTVFPFVMMHRGDGGCGGRAFLMAVMPEFGRLLQSREAAHLDGSPMGAFARPVCDSCGRFVRPLSEHVIPLADVPDQRMGAAS